MVEEREDELVAALAVRLDEARDVDGVEETVGDVAGARAVDGGGDDAVVVRGVGAEERGAAHERRADDGEVVQLGREVLREQRRRAGGEGSRRGGGDVPGDGLREEEHPARASRILRGHQARLHAAEQIEEGDGVGAEEGHQSAEGVGARRVWDGAIRRRERLDVRGPRGGGVSVHRGGGSRAWLERARRDLAGGARRAIALFVRPVDETVVIARVSGHHVRRARRHFVCRLDGHARRDALPECRSGRARTRLRTRCEERGATSLDVRAETGDSRGLEGSR